MHFFGISLGTKARPFEDQAAWLEALIAWVCVRDDLQLVIRLHPRMAANVRHSGAVQQYAKITAQLTGLPPNVVVVGADSKLSSYNIAEIADVALVAWSSMALELARFGVPVVAAFPEFAVYPTGGFIGFAEKATDYFQAIETALRLEPSIRAIFEAFRWTHFLNWSHLVDLSDLVPEPDYNKVPPYRTPRNAAKALKVLAGGEDIVALNMADLQLNDAAIVSERAAVVAAIERLIIYLMTGSVVETGPGIRLERGGVAGANTGGPQVWPVLKLGDSGNVLLTMDGRSHQRHSPLLHRLAMMLGANGELHGRPAPLESKTEAATLV
jgi:hypothetical protein